MLKTTVQVASWNVNCKKPLVFLNLTKWLSQQSPSPDIITIGLQELLSQLELIITMPSQQVLFYDNKRYEMGGAITQKQEEHFYQRMAKLIKRDNRRQKRRGRKVRLREYSKAVGGRQKRKLFEDIFIDYHRTVIKGIREDRKNVSMAK